MAYAAGNNCYSTVAEALSAQKWLLGHDSILTLGGAAYRLQYEAQQWGDDTQFVLRQMITRLSDGVVVEDTQLNYVAPTCGDLSPWHVSVEDGALIALAIGAVWAVGWAIRMVARVLASGDGNPTSES